MEESILNSIKESLGIPAEYTHFDTNIIMHINSVLMILTQLGVGPESGFIIENSTETWGAIVTDKQNLEAVKSYVSYKVKLLFDPPLSSTVMECMNRMIGELEWRINNQVEQNKKKEATQNAY